MSAGVDRGAPGLRVLVVDDERPALDEVAYLLGLDDRVAQVRACSSAAEALRVLHAGGLDAVFLDVQMPGLGGLELARVLRRMAEPPPVVFVTAHEAHAVDAFDLHAVDYVLKPVRAERLAEAVRRLLAGSDRAPAPARADPQVAVERGGVTRFVDRSEITHVEAQGDYARLHTPGGTPPDPGATLHAGAGLGRGRLRAHPPLAARRAGPRARGTHGVRALLGGGRPPRLGRRGSRAAGQPATHPRPARASDPLGGRVVSEVPPRVRVTAPPRRRPVVRPRSGDVVPPGTPGSSGGLGDLDQATRLGGVYLASLMRAQLWLAAQVLVVLGVLVGGVPLLFFLLPGLAQVDVLGLPLPWVALGGGVYPLLTLLAWGYVRRAERHERAFAELLSDRER